MNPFDNTVIEQTRKDLLKRAHRSLLSDDIEYIRRNLQDVVELLTALNSEKEQTDKLLDEYLTMTNSTADSTIHAPSVEPIDSPHFSPEQLKVDERSGAKKADVGKLRYDLIPAIPLEKFVQVLTHGSGKYGARNWEKGMDWTRLFASAQRHLWAWYQHEDTDSDSGISHLAHAICNLMFLLEFEITKPEFDDRP